MLLQADFSSLLDDAQHKLAKFEEVPDFDDGNVGDEENDDNLIDDGSYGAKKRRNSGYGEIKVIFDDTDKDKRA